MAMTDKERYESICEPAFAELKRDTEAILVLLKGANGTPGLCERVRMNERFRMATMAILGVIGSALIVQIIIAVVG